MYETGNNDNGLNPDHKEVAGYVLTDIDGKTYYYVLDWSGNEVDMSYNPYAESTNGKKTFDNKYITAQYHTHSRYYYETLNNNPNGYDGSSYKDYQTSLGLGVPVYSIGPHSVSMVDYRNDIFSGRDNDWIKKYFNDLANRKYKTTDTNTGSTSSINYGSESFTNFTIYELRRVNPFAIAVTSEWLKNPK